MKKFFTFMAVVICVCLTVGAFNWNTVDNLAKDATVIVSSKPANAAAIVDGNNGTGWQASAQTHEFTHDWVIIDLGDEKSFTDMEIVWENSHCKEFSVYTSSTEIPYTPETEPLEYNKISEEWLDAHEPAATGGNSEETGYTETIAFEQPQTARYILIYADEYNGFGTDYGMYIFEVRVANIADRNSAASLDITCDGNAVAGGDPVKVTVTPLNAIGEALTLDAVSDLTLTCDDQAVTIEGGDNGVYDVSADETGTYTLMASASAEGKTVTGELTLNVAFNWNGIENLATEKEIQGRVNSTLDDDFPPKNAVDGIPDTYYQYNGEWAGGDGWLLVDLGDGYEINAIGALYTENAFGKSMFGYANDITATEAKIAEEGTDFRWNALSEDINVEWTFSDNIDRAVGGVITTHVYDTPVVARYIMVRDTDNPKGKPCVNEIYVSGSLREAPKADKIELSLQYDGTVIGETNDVTVKVFDQYGSEFDTNVTVTAEGASYADGVITCNAKGLVTVKATVEDTDLTAEANFFVADMDDYCMENAEISASEGADADMAPVTDGGKEIDVYKEYYVLAQNEDMGANEHWLLVKLDTRYDLDLIAAIWEGACPSDYDIYLGKTTDDLELYYSEKDKQGMTTQSDRFSGKEMKGIQYIKIVTTANATPYGIKLYDLKAYGTVDPSGVNDITTDDNGLNDVYNLQGIKIRSNVNAADAFKGLPSGIYIYAGRKVRI